MFNFFNRAYLNPYIGVGVESGGRGNNGSMETQTEMAGRFGVEINLLRAKRSTQAAMSITLFADAKYCRGISRTFSYFLPTAGLRFHFLEATKGISLEQPIFPDVA